MTYFATYTPTNAPMPIAISELMMRVRSSTRCSKKVICPPVSVFSSGWSLVVIALFLVLVIGDSLLVVRARSSWLLRISAFGLLGVASRLSLDVASHDTFRYRCNHRCVRYARFRSARPNSSFGFARRGAGRYLRPGQRRLSSRSRGKGRRLRLNSGRSCRGRLRLVPRDFARLALDVAHLLFKRRLEIGGSLAELCHQLAEPAGQLRQLLRSEDHQHDHKDHDHVRNA